MQIDINGKRNITLDFNAPKKFRLTQNGAEIPYIRTGKNSFRLSKNIDGVVDLEEIIEPVKLMQPVALQPQQMAVINSQDVERLNEAVKQMALVNPADVLMINNAADQLERTQNFISEEQKKLEQSQIYLDNQQQKLNESAVNIQALETNNAERLDFAEISIYNIAEDLDTVKTATLDNINSIDTLKAESLVTQATLETKADKTDVDKIKEELNEYKDDNESFKNALSNYSGGLAVEYSVSEGGKDGQILTKITDETGVYGWKDPTPVIVKAKKMPNPSEKLKGEVYQYVGETGTYTHGFIYECQKVGNAYQWVRIDVQPNTAVWGQITGTLSDQTDLQTALNGKQDKLSTTQMEAVNSGANTSNILQITTNQNNITTINGLIPAQATTVNQLADKDFVNSSIATNTANFIGTFSSISDLEAYSGTVTNNDYAFVINREVKDNGNDWATFADLDLYDKSLLVNYDYAWVINGSKFDLYRFDYVNQTWDLRATNIRKADVTLNTAYNRYKAVVSGSITWTFEYTLNNSSFTASQWSAINSGITSGLVAEFEAKGASLDYASDILTLKDSSGNSLSSVTIQASAAADGKSITKNSSDELQTIGVINQNDTTTALKTWSGTKAEYDAIVTKDANTLYNVTDDATSGADIYSKGEVDSLLNTKASVSLNNLVINVAQYTDLGTHTVAKNGNVTFPQDITQFDYLIAKADAQFFQGRAWITGSNQKRLKMNGFWAGVDTLNGTPYAQVYSIDMINSSDNTYTVWTCSWMNLLATSGTLNEKSKDVQFYGVKVI